MDNPIELQSQSGALCAEVDLNGGMLARLQLKTDLAKCIAASFV